MGLRGFIVANNGPLRNRIAVSNTGGTTINVLPTAVLTTSIYIVRGLPSVDSITIDLGVLDILNTRVGVVGHGACRVSAARLGNAGIPSSLSHRVHTDCCFLNTLLSHFNGTRITVPNNYGLNPHPVSRRLGIFDTLNTRSDISCNVVDIHTGRVGNTRVFFSGIDINTAVGNVLSTMVTGNRAVLRGYTGRPRIISLTGFLGVYNTGVHNTNASIVGIHNIRGVRNYACDVVPSRVRTNDCVITTTTANNSILIGGIAPGRLRPVARGLHHTNIRIRRFSSTIHIHHANSVLPLGVGAVPRPNFPASVRPLVNILLDITGNADAIARDI